LSFSVLTRLGLWPGPSDEEVERPAAMVRTSNDKISPLPSRNITDAEPAKIEPDWIAENGFLARDGLARD
jgi:hypothetical protein